MNGQNKMLYIRWILFNFLKEGNSTISKDIDETGGHYSNWNKLVTERQKHAKSHLYVESSKFKCIRAECLVRAG